MSIGAQICLLNPSALSELSAVQILKPSTSLRLCAMLICDTEVKARSCCFARKSNRCQRKWVSLKRACVLLPPLLLAYAAGLKLPPASSLDVLWSSASENPPAAAFLAPLPPRSVDPAVLDIPTLCRSFPGNIGILPACLPALLEKCASVGIRNHLYLALGDFGGAGQLPRQSEAAQQHLCPLRHAGDVVNSLLLGHPLYLPLQGDFKCDQPAAPARFLPPLRSPHGPGSVFFASARWGAGGWGSGLVQWLLLHLPDMCK